MRDVLVAIASLIIFGLFWHAWAHLSPAEYDPLNAIGRLFLTGLCTAFTMSLVLES